jgi:hypothetical protein
MNQTPLATLLDQLEVAGMHQTGRLRLHFLRMRPPREERGLHYSTLEQALARGDVLISERPGGAQVGQLSIQNKSAVRLLIVGGDILRGGKQDRMVNTDILVEAGSQLDLPVSCVERDRWRFVSSKFESESSGTPSLRRSLHESVSRSYMAMGSPTSDQGEVWSTVDSHGSSLRSHSPTSNLSDYYADKRADLERLIQEVKFPDDACGVLVRIGGDRMALDVFDRADTWASYRRRLLEGYLLEGLMLPESGPAPEAGPPAPADLLKEASVEERPGVGVGRDLRVQSPRVQGSALVVGDTVVHTALFSQ